MVEVVAKILYDVCVDMSSCLDEDFNYGLFSVNYIEQTEEIKEFFRERARYVIEEIEIEIQ